MERLTFDGNFCDIAMCRELPCPHDNNCTQKQVWERLKLKETVKERLKQYEDTDIAPEEIRDMKNELCGRCGNYMRSYMGACDNCRWRDR